MAKSFIDTNVFFYAIDERDIVKQRTARQLIAEVADRGEGVVSSQVIQEFVSNAIKKFGATSRTADQMCEIFLDHAVVKGDLDLTRRALSLMDGASLSFWDALVVAAATMADCRILYTEHLNHGQTIGKVRLVNPFR